MDSENNILELLKPSWIRRENDIDKKTNIRIIFLLNELYVCTANKKDIERSIKELKIEDLNTHIRENNKVDVKTDHKKDQTVEKNKSFHIFSQEFSHSSISDNKGIVWEAKNTGRKNKNIELISIQKK